MALIPIKGEKPVIFILSGAGLSVESGIPTYRGQGSAKHNDSRVFSKAWMRCYPEKVFEAVNARIHDLKDRQPNVAHLAIAKFTNTYKDKAKVIHVTQNIDDLCEKAGDTEVIHIHGSLNESRCTKCGKVFKREGFYSKETVCPFCGAKAVRPNVVLYGEDVLRMSEIQEGLKQADFFLSVGTSGVVFPAADFVSITKKHGCHERYYLNKEPLLRERVLELEDFTLDVERNWYTREVIGNATETVPKVLDLITRFIA